MVGRFRLGGWLPDYMARTRSGVRLVFGTQPSTVVSGATLSSFTVRVETPGGALATHYSGPITADPTSSGGGALALGGTTTVNAVAGVATFDAAVPTLSDTPTAISGDPVAGYQFTLTATATGLTSAVSDAFGVTWNPQLLVSGTSAINLSSTDTDTRVAGAVAILVGAGGTVAGDEIAFTDGDGAALQTLTCVASGAGDNQWDETTTTTTSAERIRDAINASPVLSLYLLAAVSGSHVYATRLTSAVDNGLGVTETTANCTFDDTATAPGVPTYAAAIGRFGTGIVTKTDAGGNVWTTDSAAKRPLVQVDGGIPHFLGHTTSSSGAKLSPPSATLEQSTVDDARTHVGIVKTVAAAGVSTGYGWCARRPSNQGYRHTVTSSTQLTTFTLIGSAGQVLVTAPFTRAVWHLLIWRYDGSRTAGGVDCLIDDVDTTPTIVTDTLTSDHAAGSLLNSPDNATNNGGVAVRHVAVLPGVLSDGICTLYLAWAQAAGLM